MNSKYKLIIFIFLSFYSICFSQETNEDTLITKTIFNYIGLDVNYSSLDGDITRNRDYELGETTYLMEGYKSKVGFGININRIIESNNWLSFSPEVGISFIRGKLNIITFNSHSEILKGLELNRNFVFNNLYLKTNFGINIFPKRSLRVYFDISPNFGIQLISKNNGKLIGEVVNYETNPPEVSNYRERNGKLDWEFIGIQVGVRFGVNKFFELSSGKRILIKWFYEIPITRIDKRIDLRVIPIGVSIKYSIIRKDKQY